MLPKQADGKSYYPLQVVTGKARPLSICGDPAALELRHSGYSGGGTHLGYITAVRFTDKDPCGINWEKEAFKEGKGLAIVNCELQTDRHGDKWFKSSEVQYDHGSRLGLTWEYPGWNCPGSCI